MAVLIIELAIIAAADVAASLGIQRLIIDAEKSYLLQKQLNGHMKDLNQMIKGKAAKEQISAKQAELNKATMAHLKHQIRATPILLGLSIIVYFFILPQLFPAGPATYNLIFISFTYESFKDSIYFIGFVFVGSLAAQFAISRYDKKRFGRKYGDNPPKPVPAAGTAEK
jgi:uncharacterized membrane protein (DUF106 family)